MKRLSITGLGSMAAAVIAAGTLVATPAAAPRTAPAAEQATAAKAAPAEKRVPDQPAREARREHERSRAVRMGSGSHPFNLYGYHRGYTGGATSRYSPAAEDRKHGGLGRRQRAGRA